MGCPGVRALGLLATILLSTLSAATSNGGWSDVAAARDAPFAIVACTIDAVEATTMTPELFTSTYRHKRPVLLRNDSSNKATQRLVADRQAFLKAFGSASIGYGSQQDLSINGQGQEGMKVSQLLESEAWKDFGSGRRSQYAFDRGFLERNSLLRESIARPPYLPNEFSRLMFGIGPSGSGLSFHYHQEAWNQLALGGKHWMLYEPGSMPQPEGECPGEVHLDWLTKVWPKLKGTPRAPHECVQRPGDVLYLPEGWWHATLNLGDTIAVSCQHPDFLTNSSTGLVAKAHDMVETGDYRGAIRAVGRALALQPAGEADTYAVLGHAYLGLSRTREGGGLTLQERQAFHGKALALFRQAVGMNARNTGLYMNLGFALLLDERYDEAIPPLQVGLAIALEAGNDMAEQLAELLDMARSRDAHALLGGDKGVGEGGGEL